MQNSGGRLETCAVPNYVCQATVVPPSTNWGDCIGSDNLYSCAKKVGQYDSYCTGTSSNCVSSTLIYSECGSGLQCNFDTLCHSGAIYRCRNAPTAPPTPQPTQGGSENDYCGSTRLDCLQGSPRYSGCQSGLTCQYSGFFSWCDEEPIFRCMRPPTPFPTPFPTAPTVPQPTTQRPTQFPTPEPTIRYGELGELCGVTSYDCGSPIRTHCREGLKCQMDSFDMRCASVLYRCLTTPSPTKSPTVSPTTRPTQNPTLRPTLAPSTFPFKVRVIVDVMQYVKELEDYSTNVRWLRLTKPSFFSNRDQIQVDELVWDGGNYYEALIPYDQMRLTHMTLSYEVVGAMNTSSFHVRTTITSENDPDISLFSSIKRLTVWTGMGDCPTLDVNDFNTEWFPNAPEWLIEPIRGFYSTALTGGSYDGTTSSEYCIQSYTVLDNQCAKLYVEEGSSTVEMYYAGKLTLNPFIAGSGSMYDPFCFKLDPVTNEVIKDRSGVEGNGRRGAITQLFDSSSLLINYDTFFVPRTDILEDDVKLEFTNWFLDRRPMVIGSIKAFDGDGGLIKTVKVSDIQVLGGRVITNNNPYCHQRGSFFDSRCKGDLGGCCLLHSYRNYTNSLCNGVVYLSLNFNGGLHDCSIFCSRDPECVGFQLIAGWGGSNTCKLYSEMSPEFITSADNVCYVSNAQVSTFSSSTPLISLENEMGKRYHPCKEGYSVGFQPLFDSELCYKVTENSLLSEPRPSHPYPNKLAKIRVILPAETRRVMFEVGHTPNTITFTDSFGVERTSKDNSAVFYSVSRGGALVSEGSLVPIPQRDSLRRTVEVDLIDTGDFRVKRKESLNSDSMRLYNVFCDENDLEKLYKFSSTIRSSLDTTGLDTVKVCDEVSTALNTGDSNELNKQMSVVKETLFEAFVESGMDRAPEKIIAFETFNDPDIEHDRDSFIILVEYLDAIGTRITCRELSEPYIVDDIATELYYQYKFPGSYKARCDFELDETYSYQGVTYVRGRQNAPCVSNTQCYDGFVCSAWVCTQLNMTDSSEICPARTYIKQPDYYALAPSYRRHRACAYENVYSEESFNYDLWDFNDDDGFTRFSFKDRWSSFYQSEQSSVNPDYRTVVNAKRDYFKTKGNQQECYLYGSSELAETSASLRSPFWGYNLQVDFGELYYMRRSYEKYYSNFYERVYPHKPPGIKTDTFVGHNVPNVEHCMECDFSEHTKPCQVCENQYAKKVAPSVFAFADAEGLEDLINVLHMRCLSTRSSELATLRGANQLECEKEEKCQWHEALGQCVASKREVEIHVCLAVSDEKQCWMMGFCKWERNLVSSEPDMMHCVHESGSMETVKPEEILEAICPDIVDQVSCGRTGCFWDQILEICLADDRQSTVLGKFTNLPLGYHHGDLNLVEHSVKCHDYTFNDDDDVSLLLRYGSANYSHWRFALEGDGTDRAVEVCHSWQDLQIPEVCESYGFVMEYFFGVPQCKINDHRQNPIPVGSAYGTRIIVTVDCVEILNNLCTDVELRRGECYYPATDNSKVCRIYTKGTIQSVVPSCLSYSTEAMCLVVDGCDWIPYAQKCVFSEGSSFANEFARFLSKVFYMPPLKTQSDVIKYYNVSIQDTSVPYNWREHFEAWDSPTLEERIFNNTAVCHKIHTFEDCSLVSICKWDFKFNDCQPNRCSYLSNLYSTLLSKDVITDYIRPEEVGRAMFLRTRPCKRIKGCKEEPVTLRCVPEEDTQEVTIEDMAADDVTYCQAMLSNYNLCDFQPSHRLVTCMFVNDVCLPRYLVLSSMSLENALNVTATSHFSLDSFEFLERFYNETVDDTFDRQGEIVTAQFLSIDEIVNLGGKPFMDRRLVNLTEVLPGIQEEYILNEVEFYSLQDSWPSVHFRFNPYNQNITELLAFLLEMRESRTTSPQHEYVSTLLHEAVDYHRKIARTITRETMNGVEDADNVAATESEFINYINFYPNLGEVNIEMYASALEEITSKSYVENFLSSLEEDAGDDNLDFFNASGSFPEGSLERNQTFLENMLRAYSSANMYEYSRYEFEGRVNESSIFDNTVGRVGQTYRGDLPTFGLLPAQARNALLFTLNLVPLLMSTGAYTRFANYLVSLGSPRVITVELVIWEPVQMLRQRTRTVTRRVTELTRTRSVATMTGQTARSTSRALSMFRAAGRTISGAVVPPLRLVSSQPVPDLPPPRPTPVTQPAPQPAPPRRNPGRRPQRTPNRSSIGRARASQRPWYAGGTADSMNNVPPRSGISRMRAAQQEYTRRMQQYTNTGLRRRAQLNVAKQAAKRARDAANAGSNAADAARVASQTVDTVVNVQRAARARAAAEAADTARYISDRVLTQAHYRARLNNQLIRQLNMLRIRRHNANLARSAISRAMYRTILAADDARSVSTAASLASATADALQTTDRTVDTIQSTFYTYTAFKQGIARFSQVVQASRVGRLFAKLGKVLQRLKFLRRALGWAGFIMDIVTLVLTIKSYFDIADKDPYCVYLDGNWNSLSRFAGNLGTGQNLKVFRIFFGDDELQVPTKQCSQDVSYAMYDADGKMGIVDSRYLIPQCDSDFVSGSALDEYFSNPDTGMNTICSNSTECKTISFSGECVMGRCVFDTGYVGMRRCTSTLFSKTITSPYVFRRPKMGSLAPEHERRYYNPTFMEQNIEWRHVNMEPLEEGRVFLRECKTRFAQITWDVLTGEVDRNILCFDMCDSWEVNDDPGIETYMMKMNTTNLTSGAIPGDFCTSSAQCNAGRTITNQICTTGGYCVGPVGCEKHRDCFGAWYPLDRLPYCDPKRRICRDLVPDACNTFESCTERADNTTFTVGELETGGPLFPEDTATGTPTKSPTAISTSISPTSAPTLSPTITCAPLQEYVNPVVLEEYLVPLDLTDKGGFGFAIDKSNDLIISGTPKTNSGKGAAYILQNIGGGWTTHTKLLPPSNTGILFGEKVSIENNVTAVASKSSNGIGFVHVFMKDSNDVWNFQITLSRNSPGDLFGFSLKIHNNILYVGAPMFEGVGAVFIYSIYDSFSLIGTINSPSSSQMLFGYSLGAFGNTLAVGSPLSDTLHVYEVNEDGLYVLEYTKQHDLNQSRFGHALVISNDTIVVGAPATTIEQCGIVNAGSVTTFYRTNGVWEIGETIFAPRPQNGHLYGSRISFDGDYLMVSAKRTDDNVGAVHLYRKELNGSNFTYQRFIKDIDEGSVEFGTDVVVQDGVVVISSEFKRNTGAVFISDMGALLTRTSTPTARPTSSPTLSPTSLLDQSNANNCTFHEINDAACNGTNTYIGELNWASTLANPFDKSVCVRLCDSDSTCRAVTFSTSPRMCTFHTENLVPSISESSSTCIVKNETCATTPYVGSTPSPSVQTSCVYQQRHGDICLWTIGAEDNVLENYRSVSECVEVCNNDYSCRFFNAFNNTCRFFHARSQAEILILIAENTTCFEKKSGCGVPFDGNFTNAPTQTPTMSPTYFGQTPFPSASPTYFGQTADPTASPSTSPSVSPSASPTYFGQTANPTASPSVSPTASPSTSPTTSPTASPTTPSPTSSPTNSTSSSIDEVDTIIFTASAVLFMIVLLCIAVLIATACRPGRYEERITRINFSGLLVDHTAMYKPAHIEDVEF